MTVISPQNSSSSMSISSSKKTSKSSKKKRRARRKDNQNQEYSTISRDDSFDSYDSDDFEERFGLVSPLSIEPSNMQGFDYRDGVEEADGIMWTGRNSGRGGFCWLGLFMGIVLIVAVVMLAIPDSSSVQATKAGSNTTTQYTVKGKPVYYHPESSKYSSVPVDYDCPTDLPEDQTGNATSSKDPNSIDFLIDNNLTVFLDEYRNSVGPPFWGDKTFEETKAVMHDFKSHYFAENLQNDDSIYGADCGVGLDLLLTLEIVEEIKGKSTHLYAYGSDFFGQTAVRANTLIDHFVEHNSFTKGKFCPGASSHLGFVPSASFDLVYTAHISPLIDPLDLKLGKDENTARYKSICGNSSDWQTETLAQLAQQKQEEWYQSYVSELVRIVKPGAPVIVERVTNPFCEVPSDRGGGVSREWWETAVVNFTSWDIDPSSLEFQDDALDNGRYHVFMRKNKSA